MEPRETQPAVRKIETGAVVEPGYFILMAGEARRRGAGHVRQLVILGDGAAWIWDLATRHFPEATKIVDLYHAREHLHELARLLEFILGDHKQDWLDERLADLDAGDIPAICAAAGAFPPGRQQGQRPQQGPGLLPQRFAAAPVSAG